MKKSFLLVVMAMAALCAAATDRFYIEDFSISGGETRTVSIMLDNETAYTAFQTDIYLPEGLIVEQEEGDYIFDLTSRKGRDHNIASQVQADGAIRIMSYSPSIKTYSGNSGALVTFNVTATGNAGGETTIELKNTLFTTKTGTEVAFNDETCHVNIPLKDLSGEIVVTPHGEFDDTIYYIGEDSCYFGYNYTSIEICYTGDEDVTFTILGVNNDDWQKNGRSSSFTLNLSDLPEECVRYDEFYYVNYEFEVVVSADGYNDLSEFYSISNPIEPAPQDIPELDIITTDFNVVLVVKSEWHARWILLVDGDENMDGWSYEEDYEDGDGRFFDYYERSDESHWITVQVGAKFLEQDYFWMTSPIDVYVPALNNGLEIQQCGPNGEISEDQNNHYALIRYYGDHSIYYDEDENEDSEIVQDDPVCFNFMINDHKIYCDIYGGVINQLEIDDEILIDWEDENDNLFNCGPISYRPEINGLIVDLLPFGDTYGGNYDIDASAVVLNHVLIVNREYEVEAEAHLEYYVPIEAPTITTQMTNDAVIVNLSSDMDYKKLIVDGEEVLELPYVAGRTYNDYSIIVKAGHSPDSIRWAWTEETSILIPAKEVPLLRGDVDGDGSVSISDVTTLIDYLLSGNAQAINAENADVDQDGAISISDVTALIDYLLSGNWPEEPEPTPVIMSYTVNGVTFNMVEVEGGTFQMGATTEQGDGARDNEKPVHEVTLSGYSIGQTEVTQELWQVVMGTNPSRFNDDVNKPVEKISWNECQTFIATLNELTGKNFRLPTEAEWEFAARGGIKSEGYKYAGSDDLNEIAWYNYNAYAVGSSSPNYGTHAVSTKAANILGLYDMTGNVWEWCQDWSGTYSDEPQTDPTGPITGTTRIIRGGGWTNYPSLLRVAARADYSTSYISNFIGFRLAL